MENQKENTKSDKSVRAFLQMVNASGKRGKRTEQENEYLRAWAENPEFAASAKLHGLGPDLPPTSIVATPDEGEEGDEILDPTDLAAYEAWRDSREPKENTPAETPAGSDAAIEARAHEVASEMVRAVIQALTRSRFSGLARQAETLVLAFSPRESEAQRQTEIARKYGCTRAAISKDIAHMRKHKSIGKITEHVFSLPAARVRASERATKVHAETRALAAQPPAGSMADLVNSMLTQKN